MEKYIGCKIILAEPMSEESFKGITGNPDRPGYQVCYPDGYISWSPKEVFEEAYRKVSDKEIEMIKK